MEDIRNGEQGRMEGEKEMEKGEAEKEEEGKAAGDVRNVK